MATGGGEAADTAAAKSLSNMVNSSKVTSSPAGIYNADIDAMLTAMRQTAQAKETAQAAAAAAGAVRAMVAEEAVTKTEDPSSEIGSDDSSLAAMSVLPRAGISGCRLRNDCACCLRHMHMVYGVV